MKSATPPPMPRDAFRDPTRNRSLWQLIQEPPPPYFDAPQHVDRPVQRLWWRYFLRPFPISFLVIIFAGIVGGLQPYTFVVGTGYLTDHVIELDLTAAPGQGARGFDPTMPGQHERFLFDQPHERRGLIDRLDTTVGMSTDQKFNRLLKLSIVMVVANALCLFLQAAVVWITIRVGQNIQFRLRQHVHDKLNRLPLSYHDQRSPGRLLTHLFSDVQVIDNVAVTLMRIVPAALAQLVIGLVICWLISPGLSVWVLITLPSYALCYSWFQRRMRDVARNGREIDGKLNAHVANRLSHFQLVKAFQRETREAIEFICQARPVLRFALAGAALNIAFVVVCGLIGTVCVTIVLWRGALLARSGVISAGDLIAFHAALATLFVPVTQLANLALSYHNMRYASAKIMRLLDEPIELDDPDEDELGGHPPVQPPTSAPALRFEGVSFRYNASAPVAMQGITFDLPAGKRLAIMGPSGAGKSTLARLAARLYDPTEGRILLGGTDLRQFRLAHLRQALVFVAQEPIVFSGTLADNITYGVPGAPSRQIIAAAQYAQIHNYIHQLPEQYRTLTHERGLTLSGGQKQRVSLARALLTDARALILDDCTSALDAETESRLVAGFDDALEGRTTLLVTHRVSVALSSDLILMLEDGQMVEFGSPAELLRAGGAFAQLAEEQRRKAAEAVA